MQAYGKHNVTEGMTVYAADDVRLGTVMKTGEGEFLIEKGIFFPRDYMARYEDVQQIRSGTIYLRRRSDEFKETAEGISRTDRLTGTTAPASSAARTGVGSTTAGETRIPIQEEQLTARKTEHEAGAVRIKKEVVTEQKSITVPVRKEQVIIERVPASSATPTEPIGEKATEIRVPIKEEEVTIEKRPVVKEEIRIRKDATEESKTVTGTVRKETAKVEKEGKVEGGDIRTEEERRRKSA